MTRPLRTAWTVAALGLIAGGCASVGGGRVGLADRSRTTATSGGERVRVASGGTTGDSAFAELGEPEVRGRADGRISGRVLDPDGRPVARAEVRLADGSSRAGRDLRALTDDAGGFTLRGLRPGAAYTLVAQGDDDRSSLAGRATARAPSGNVRIRLREGDDGDDPPAESTPAASRRVDRTSERSAIDEFLGSEGEGGVQRPSRGASRLNDADLPPADEAEAANEPLPKAEAPPPTSAVAWRPSKGDSQVAAVKVETLKRTGQPEADEPEEGSRLAPEDDGPNPLPPAKERPAEGIKPSSPAAGPPGPGLDPPAAEPPVVPPTVAPTEPDPAPEAPVDSASIPAEVAPRRRATWADLASSPDDSKAGASLPISTRRLPPDEGRGASTAAKAPAGRLGLLGFGKAKSSEALTSAAFAPASCRFDAKAQRLVDFQLPDLDGRPLRLHDLDSDYVLLDFWGTWCGPCRESIPHLVELQSRYGSKCLKVVGIATEHDATTEERARRVDGVARSLGVTYPLVLSEADGKPCPLQEALHVQAYPTLILLDRTGRILWRGTGAEGVTLSRLDRVIAARADTAVLRR